MITQPAHDIIGVWMLLPGGLEDAYSRMVPLLEDLARKAEWDGNWRSDELPDLARRLLIVASGEEP